MSGEDATVTATAPAGGSVTATAAQPAQAAASVSVVEHGEASRLPDTSWTWRRILIFGVCIVASFLQFWGFRIIEAVAKGRLEVSPKLLDVIGDGVEYGYYTLWLGLALYGVGATMTDIAKVFAAVKTSRKETITSGPPEIAPAVVAAATGNSNADKPPWERK